MNQEPNMAGRCARRKHSVQARDGSLTQGGRQSKPFNQITRFHTKGFGNAQQRMKAYPLFTAFNFADINRMQVGLFGQFFLAQAGLVAVSPNGVTEGFEILSRTRHSGSAKQGGLELRTPNMGLFSACHDWRAGYRKDLTSVRK